MLQTIHSPFPIRKVYGNRDYALAGIDLATERFRHMIENYIAPLVFGAEIQGPVKSNTPLWDIVSFDTIYRINVAIPDTPGVQFVLKRSSPFLEEEKSLVRNIVAAIHNDNIHRSDAFHLLTCNAVERALSLWLSPEHADTVYKVIQVYNQWSGETFEGKKHAHTTGIYPGKSRKEGRNLFEQKNMPALKGLASGDNCLLAVCNKGNLLGVENLSAKSGAFKKNHNVLAPIDLADIALWTDTGGKIAIHMTAEGELCIFRNKMLVFAKRRSLWRGLPHKRLLEELLNERKDPDEAETQRATYLTMLDMAFSRSGACLGILTAPAASGAAMDLVSRDMLFSAASPSAVVDVLKSVVSARKFQDISRTLRKRLCSLDGAVILDAKGEILTAGAMIRTSGANGRGGGRSAAARALSEKGVGFKVSRDGSIEIYIGGRALADFA